MQFCKVREIRSMDQGLLLTRKWVWKHQELHPNLCSAKPRGFQNVDGFLCSLTITCHKASLRHKDTSHPRRSSVTSLFGTAAVSCKIDTNISWGRMDLSSNIKVSKMIYIYGLSCVILYFYGVLEKQALVTILSLLMLLISQCVQRFPP